MFVSMAISTTFVFSLKIEEKRMDMASILLKLTAVLFKILSDISLPVVCIAIFSIC